MAKKQPNLLKQKHIEEDISFIFERIDDETFSLDLMKAAAQLRCKGRLETLKVSLEELKKLLLSHAARNPEDRYAIRTARSIESTLCDFFERSDPNIKQKVAKQFWVTSRRAWFTQRTKTILAGTIVGVSVFILSLGLIIGTGGLALIGMGWMLGISLVFGLLGGGASALLGYKFGENESEGNGKSVTDALIALSNDASLSSFIVERDLKLIGRRPEPAQKQKTRDKYHIERSASEPRSSARETAPDESLTVEEPLSTWGKIKQTTLNLKNRLISTNATPATPQPTPPPQAKVTIILPRGAGEDGNNVYEIVAPSRQSAAKKAPSSNASVSASPSREPAKPLTEEEQQKYSVRGLSYFEEQRAKEAVKEKEKERRYSVGVVPPAQSLSDTPSFSFKRTNGNPNNNG